MFNRRVITAKDAELMSSRKLEGEPVQPTLHPMIACYEASSLNLTRVICNFSKKEKATRSQKSRRVP